MKLRLGIGSVAALALLAACAEKELILPGERLDVRATLDGAAVEAGSAPLDASAGATPLALPAMVNSTSWTHRNGSPSHKTIHLALGPSLSHVWAANIGQGDARKHRITADPIVADGRIYTLDSRASVVATSTAGATLWSRDLTPVTDRQDDGSGGGLAYAGGQVFATTGFGELVALNAATGDIIWRQKFDAPVAGAPTVDGGLVYVVARDSSAWAVDAANGRVRWQMPATPSASGVSGSAAPAVSDRLVLFPFSSGEVLAALKTGGVRTWGTSVVGQRLGRAYAGVSDITGDPVIVGDTVYIGNASGRVAAIDANSGERIWTAREGTTGPVWPVGNAVFLVSDEDRLIRLDAETGATVWSVDLPYFKTAKVRRREGIYAHYGPILAGGRLIIASSDGQLRSFDPSTGEELGRVEIPGGATTNPVVVGGTLYVVSAKGQLHAFR